MILSNARLFDGIKFLENTSVEFENGVITKLGNNNNGIDCHGEILAPGFVDIHMHGIKGFDCMNEGHAVEISKCLPMYGTTSFCPASVTEDIPAIRKYLSYIHEAKKSTVGSRVLGAYLEGPYLAKEVKGAHIESKLTDPQISHYKELSEGYEEDIIRMTLAPEKNGGMELVDYLYKHGVVVSIGHSVASYAQACKAAELGVRSSTHTFNGMKPLHHRNPGTVGAVLTNPLIKAEFIADLVHIDVPLIKLIRAAKGIDSCYYVTDSIEATGMPDGNYKLGGEPIVVKDGIAHMGESLAGSTLTMDKGLRNLVFTVGLPLEEALRMATYNPAQVIGRDNIGCIKIGALADFVLLDDELNVSATYIRGVQEY